MSLFTRRNLEFVLAAFLDVICKTPTNVLIPGRTGKACGGMRTSEQALASTFHTNKLAQEKQQLWVSVT